MRDTFHEHATQAFSPQVYPLEALVTPLNFWNLQARRRVAMELVGNDSDRGIGGGITKFSRRSACLSGCVMRPERG